MHFFTNRAKKGGELNSATKEVTMRYNGSLQGLKINREFREIDIPNKIYERYLEREEQKRADRELVVKPAQQQKQSFFDK
jgi:hypothetical protein